jgi:hypothetical protein
MAIILSLLACLNAGSEFNLLKRSMFFLITSGFECSCFSCLCETFETLDQHLEYSDVPDFFCEIQDQR